jgi:HlyD family secretion protein
LKKYLLTIDPSEFSPALLRIQTKPPAPLTGWMLRLLIGLVAGVLLWSAACRLDIVAVADGKLVPSSYLKIVQPSEQGIVKEILVKEGQRVDAGQVLIHMDSVLTDADARAIQTEYDNKRLALHRIDAQLARKPLVRMPGDPSDLFAQISAQHAANVRAYENALAQENAVLVKAKHDLAGANATKAKLEQILPHYVEQERAFEKLTKDGFAGHIMFTDKQRERIEKEQDLRAQEAIILSNQALIQQSEQKLVQITAEYRRNLQTERVDTAAQLEKATQELAKLAHRQELLELRAPQAGVVKDLATHTAGTVTSPGTILMTLVPEGDRLVAEVWVSNEDVGFVRPGQPAKLKLAAFQFQKYGLLQGTVLQLNPDATEGSSNNARSDPLTARDRPAGPLAFRALVELESQQLVADGERYPLQAGMQVVGEIHLGTRSVLEYLLSPVRGAFHDAARER